MKHSLQGVWSLANTTIGEMESWLRGRGKSVKLQYPEIAQARLLKLQVWSYRYSLTVEEILDLVMPVLLPQMRYKKSSYGMGVTVKTLTSEGTEKILQIEIKKFHPDGDHILSARVKEQDKQLLMEKIEKDGLQPKTYYGGKIKVDETTQDLDLDEESISQFVINYGQHVDAMKREYRKQAGAKWRRRKPYRGQPW